MKANEFRVEPGFTLGQSGPFTSLKHARSEVFQTSCFGWASSALGRADGRWLGSRSTISVLEIPALEIDSGSGSGLGSGLCETRGIGFDFQGIGEIRIGATFPGDDVVGTTRRSWAKGGTGRKRKMRSTKQYEKTPRTPTSLPHGSEGTWDHLSSTKRLDERVLE